MPNYRNPADLLGLGRDLALARLLRACGAEEACIGGGASDCDQFLALAAALPLCGGHSLRDRVNAALSAATGLSVPLCPHTARLYWDTWIEIHWYGGATSLSATSLSALPSACTECVCPSPRVLQREELTALPDPTAIGGESPEAWSRALEAALLEAEAGQRTVVFTLPDGYHFLRPDPYHAGLVVGKAFRGEVLTDGERDLLFAQALRVWGLCTPSRPILLRGGDPSAVTALLAYLEASKALPSLVWIPDDPADAGAVSGLYSRVGTGYWQGEENEKAYAAVAPIGRATAVE